MFLLLLLLRVVVVRNRDVLSVVSMQFILMSITNSSKKKYIRCATLIQVSARSRDVASRRLVSQRPIIMYLLHENAPYVSSRKAERDGDRLLVIARQLVRVAKPSTKSSLRRYERGKEATAPRKSHTLNSACPTRLGPCLRCCDADPRSASLVPNCW